MGLCVGVYVVVWVCEWVLFYVCESEFVVVVCTFFFLYHFFDSVVLSLVWFGHCMNWFCLLNALWVHGYGLSDALSCPVFP
mgnify:CR=1 FL=1